MTATPSPQAMKEHLDATAAHIGRVRYHVRHFNVEMRGRAQRHDASKLEAPEAPVFAEASRKLAGLTYGSDEYHAERERLGEALEHHYARNSHHPEHHDDGVAGMTLHDVVEMWCDWQAAVERHDDGDIMASIDHNEERFDLAPQLADIFRNTARRS